MTRTVTLAAMAPVVAATIAVAAVIGVGEDEAEAATNNWV
jgi:hypothetical protein